MDALEWFAKRDRIAAALHCPDPKEVPPEAVWFLDDDQSFTESEIQRAREIAYELTATGQNEEIR